jgi:hypothetical protein
LAGLPVGWFEFLSEKYSVLAIRIMVTAIYTVWQVQASGWFFSRTAGQIILTFAEKSV